MAKQTIGKPTRKTAPAKKAGVRAPGSGQPRPAQDKLNALGIDWACERIADAVPMADMAKEAGVSIGQFYAWIESTPEFAARAREARKSMARFWDDKAQQEIESASDPFALAKAKELAHHYRWRASKIAPKEYGEKVAVGGADDLPPVQARVAIEFVSPQ